MLFNLYVSDLEDHLPSSIGPFQYADDTTIYSSCPAPALQRCAQELNSTLNTVSSWSNDSHLEGGIGGYPIPQYRKKKGQIPKYRVENRLNTDTAYFSHIYNRFRILIIASI